MNKLKSMEQKAALDSTLESKKVESKNMESNLKAAKKAESNLRATKNAESKFADSRRRARQKGLEAEDLACKWLENNGFTILLRNFYAKMGEIDIIATRAGVLHFIEVKSAKNTNPAYNITPAKLSKIQKSIEVFFSYALDSAYTQDFGENLQNAKNLPNPQSAQTSPTSQIARIAKAHSDMPYCIDALLIQPKTSTKSTPQNPNQILSQNPHQNPPRTKSQNPNENPPAPTAPPKSPLDSCHITYLENISL
ncbi:hypothetical protein BKN38_03345 [Helicobacter sp. CLO-3]|uniref:YraN family protein n=1 Tax=unclassified Helicobacter TaxID=2593540 RepID=UPI000805855C|nr:MULTISPECIES: YraN family protein [unclassified Helicobacter]OBV28501.1 hypothetical protein BA723_02000 [Helicobacter sp. CLO-3]OHU84186.1 hypothetical protein BKN38_03345 [Helicobacter sp. CLO-3]